MRRIPLSTGRHHPQDPVHWAMVDNEDFKALSKYSWTFRLLKKRVGYAYRTEYGDTVLMHRQIVDAKEDDVVIHLDKNGLNNQRSNLKVKNV